MRLSTPRDISEPFAVRKRNIETRNLQRCGSEDDSKSSKRICSDDSTSSLSGDDASSAANSFLRGVKKHARYVPDVSVPMSKEQLSAWRKEARRVRNRESAAFSRQKTRSRIEELEGQVDKLQEKYMQALQRIADLENGVPGSFTPVTLCQDMIQLGHSTPAATTLTYRSEPLFNSEDLDQPQHMDMFSRSTAVKTCHDAASFDLGPLELISSSSDETLTVGDVPGFTEMPHEEASSMLGEMHDYELGEFLSEAFGVQSAEDNLAFV